MSTSWEYEPMQHSDELNTFSDELVPRAAAGERMAQAADFLSDLS